MDNNSTTPEEIQLADHHLQMLESESGIAPDVIEDRGYGTVADSKRLKQFGFRINLGPGLMIPLYTPDGLNGSYLYRLDDPKEIKPKPGKSSGNSSKRFANYAVPKAQKAFLDCPPKCREQLKNASIPLYVTDDAVKADALASRGLCAVAIVGLWSYLGKKNPAEIVRLLDLDHIEFRNRKIIVLFDADVLGDAQANKIFQRLVTHLKQKSSQTKAVDLTKLSGDPSKGIIDWFAEGHSTDELEKAIESSEVSALPQAPIYTIMEDDGLEMNRPLCLINGKAYAATWVTINKKTEEGNESFKGMVIIGEDGKIFGGNDPVENIGFEIHLPQRVDPQRAWSGKGVKQFQRGEHPDALDVFRRLVGVADCFIDFNKSLADQKTMCELIACWTFSTWHLDAFNVVGYLWITGEKGSGKTNLLLVISELSYLAFFISLSGSFASLRDMADYGAALCFDDADNITDSRNVDPNKMALLLAGNRRGITVPLKEPGPDNGWNTRLVNAYAPRAFSAIGMPNSTLSSRCIILPLLRTSDHAKGNGDPQDHDAWPHDRRKLVDDLWNLALSNLSRIPQYDKWVGQHAQLSGRNLQPWIGVLAIAKWLDDLGVQGLYERMQNLALDYQTQRAELEIADPTRIILESLCVCAVRAIRANRAIKSIKVTVSVVTDTVAAMIKDQELDIDPESLPARKVGLSLRRLRFTQTPRPGGKGSRQYEIHLQELTRLCESYKVQVPSELVKTEANDTVGLPPGGTAGTNGTNGIKKPSSGEPSSENPSQNEIIEQHCHICSGSDFWVSDDGVAICATCHPKPQSTSSEEVMQ